MLPNITKLGHPSIIPICCPLPCSYRQQDDSVAAISPFINMLNCDQQKDYCRRRLSILF